jgi:hypothetical protein
MNSLDLSSVESSHSANPAELSNSSTVPEPLDQATERGEICNALNNSAELLLLGHFEDALSVFVPFHERGKLSAAHAVAVARAEARVFTSRGYPFRAQNVLLEIKEAFHQYLDELSALELSVHLAFVTIVGCGEALENDSVLQEGQDILDEYEIDGYDQSSVSCDAIVISTNPPQTRYKMTDKFSSR